LIFKMDKEDLKVFDMKGIPKNWKNAEKFRRWRLLR